MNESDARALALVVFQKIHRDLPAMGEEPSDRLLRGLILDAVNLLPEYNGRPDDEKPNRSNFIRVRKSDEKPEQEIVLNIQGTLDSLRTVWREYQRQSEPEKSN